MWVGTGALQKTGRCMFATKCESFAENTRTRRELQEISTSGTSGAAIKEGSRGEGRCSHRVWTVIIERLDSGLYNLRRVADEQAPLPPYLVLPLSPYLLDEHLRWFSVPLAKYQTRRWRK